MPKRKEQIVFQEHPSDALVNQTLQMMNEKLAQQRQQQIDNADAASRASKRRKQTRWISSVAVAAAAFVLCVSVMDDRIGIEPAPMPSTGIVSTNAPVPAGIGAPLPVFQLAPVSFQYKPDMRLETVVRASGDQKEDLTALRGEMDAALMPTDGQLVRSEYIFYDFAMNENSAPLWVASAVYEGRAPIRLTVSNFATTLYNALKDGSGVEVDKKQIWTGVDTESSDFFAAWQSGEWYVQMQIPEAKEWTDTELVACIKSMLSLPVMAK